MKFFLSACGENCADCGRAGAYSCDTCADGYRLVGSACVRKYCYFILGLNPKGKIHHLNLHESSKIQYSIWSNCFGDSIIDNFLNCIIILDFETFQNVQLAV